MLKFVEHQKHPSVLKHLLEKVLEKFQEYYEDAFIREKNIYMWLFF